MVSISTMVFLRHNISTSIPRFTCMYFWSFHFLTKCASSNKDIFQLLCHIPAIESLLNTTFRNLCIASTFYRICINLSWKRVLTSCDELFSKFRVLILWNLGRRYVSIWGKFFKKKKKTYKLSLHWNSCFWNSTSFCKSKLCPVFC